MYSVLLRHFGFIREGGGGGGTYSVLSIITINQDDVVTSIFRSDAVHVLEVLAASLHMQVNSIRSH